MIFNNASLIKNKIALTKKFQMTFTVTLAAKTNQNYIFFTTVFQQLSPTHALNPSSRSALSFTH